MKRGWTMDTHWLTDSAFWIGFFNIIIADLVLSGDNAVIIGMAARKLPEQQRKKAIAIGAGAAVFLRASLTAVASYLLNIPLLMTIGGLLLLWIAFKLLYKEEDDDKQVEAGADLKSAIKTIIIADVVMSLDNVLAVAGAARGNLFLLIFGLALSIPLIMWGSKWVAALMNKFPWLIYVGAAVLGYTAGHMLVEDPIVQKTVLQGQPFLTTSIPYILTVAVVVVGIVLRKRKFKDAS